MGDCDDFWQQSIRFSTNAYLISACPLNRVGDCIFRWRNGAPTNPRPRFINSSSSAGHNYVIFEMSNGTQIVLEFCTAACASRRIHRRSITITVHLSCGLKASGQRGSGILPDSATSVFCRGPTAGSGPAVPTEIWLGVSEPTVGPPFGGPSLFRPEAGGQ